MKLMLKEFLFVYGTLRRGFSNPARNVLEEHARWLSTAVMRGILYEIYGYPGAVLSDDPEDLVTGDLYEVENPDFIFSVLDDYEECNTNHQEPHEYRRKKLRVHLQNGDVTEAWVYLYEWDVSDKMRILSGDYLNYREGLN